MRDRLIELLIKRGVTFRTCDIADYLLNNGVIVPPCKVGDTVYWLEDIGIQKLPDISEYIVENIVVGLNPSKYILYCKRKTSNNRERFFNESLGKTVFFTKEEAEKALKESVQE